MKSAPRMPVSVDAASIALYKEIVNKPGILKALDNLDSSLIESLAKLVPGYINARWEGKPGIDVGTDKDVNMWYMFNFANEGRYKYEDYAAKLETFANQAAVAIQRAGLLEALQGKIAQLEVAQAALDDGRRDPDDTLGDAERRLDTERFV